MKIPHFDGMKTRKDGDFHGLLLLVYRRVWAVGGVLLRVLLVEVWHPTNAPGKRTWNHGTMELYGT